MKAIWMGDSDPLELINGKEYEILGSEWGGTMFSVVDETGEPFVVTPREMLDIIMGNQQHN